MGDPTRRFLVPCILVIAGLLVFPALDVVSRMNTLYTAEAYPITRLFVNIAPWVTVAVFAGGSIISLIKISRDQDSQISQLRKLTIAYLFAIVVVVPVVIYWLFGGASDYLIDFNGREHFINPGSPDWISIYALLCLALLVAALPPALTGAPKWLSRNLAKETPEAVEAELAGALGLSASVTSTISDHGEPSQDYRDIEKQLGDLSTDPLTRLALAQSDGHARLILKYYAQGYSQANLGFISSLAFAIVGFIAILLSAFSLWFNGGGSVVSTSITGAAGGISGAVSFLFFRRADKGRELMMELVDKLRSDREQELNVLRSIGQMDKFDDGSLKDVLRTAATLQFMNSSVTLEDLANFMKASKEMDNRN